MEMTTKERILEAAFSFYRDIVFDNISLSQIAAKVGITKPAIFKHFKNKEALRQAMDDRVFSEISFVMEQMDSLFKESKHASALSLIIDFLASHREYAFYLLSTTPLITEDSIFLELRRRGVNLFNSIFAEDGSVLNTQSYFLTIFESATFICFLLFWFDAEDAGFVTEQNKEQFISKFNFFIENGLDSLTPITNAEQLANIDLRCNEVLGQLPPISRTFLALASVIEQKGVQNVTVEAIAGELGLAKSSLYSSYKNKEDMLRNLIQTEVGQLYLSVLRNVRLFESVSEKIYAMFCTEIRYFISRPQVITVLQRLFFSGVALKEEVKSYLEHNTNCGNKDRSLEELFSKELVLAVPDVGLPNLNSEMLVSWLFSLPAMLYMHCTFHGFSEKLMVQAVQETYLHLAYGLK